MSPKSAGLAVKMGYSNVKVYLQGDPGWQESGHFLVPTDTFVLEDNIILIDLRDADRAAQAHIPRAVNIPFEDLEDASEQFPRFAGAPIVFYGDDAAVSEAIALLRGWGYRTVSGIAGGIDRWVASGQPVVKGAPATDIVWKRKLAKGEVTLAEFQQVIDEQPENRMILDVRGPEEVVDGMIEGAVHIPLDQLEGRLDELPADKQIVIHCTTGARAEMAWDILSRAGLSAHYVMAHVECADGSCTISE
jgi:rhodanese-related sulfurtransferase